MRRLLEVMREIYAVIAAASSASAAVTQHRMPSKAALNTLGIAEDQMRTVRL